jgi:hypothetical protein
MREQSINEYLWFGTVLRYLQDVRQGYEVHGDAFVAANMQRFLDGLARLGLTITANAATNEGVYEILEELNSTEDDARLTSAQAARITKAVTAVRKTLSAEGAEKKAFVTAPKRWDVDRLLTDPGAMFGEGVYEELDSQAAFDFKEACKCIAFECPTAAAFHTMRGTEAVLRSFYCYVVRQKRLAKEKRMWGPMVEKLRSRSQPPPKALLDNLDAIRHNFRNPTQHPDEIYSVDGAQDLLGLVIPAINRMTELMRK